MRSELLNQVAVLRGIMLPIVAFMMALQRHLVRGLALGPIKG
jgi:ABC-type glycerol-3-phosphate transport system permease component